MDLDHVHTGLLGTHRAGAHLIDDGHQHFLAGLIGKEHHVVMQALTHLVKLLLHEQAVDGVHIVLRVENLDAQLGAVSVHAVGQLLEGRDLAVVKQLGGGRKAVDGCNVAQNDVAYAALCQTGVEAHVLLADHAVLLVTGGQRGNIMRFLKVCPPTTMGCRIMFSIQMPPYRCALMNAAVFSSTAARAVSVAKLCPPPAMVSTSGAAYPSA